MKVESAFPVGIAKQYSIDLDKDKIIECKTAREDDDFQCLGDSTGTLSD